MKTIWYEINEQGIVGEFMLLKGLRSQKKGLYRCDIYAETKRTNQQNKYMHVVFTLLQHGLYYAGYEDINTMEKAKDFVKKLFLSYEKENKQTGMKYETVRGTSELSKDEGIEFIERVLQFAAEELGMYIPTVEEFQANPTKWGLAALKM